MAYCIASDVRLIIETSLSDSEIEAQIEMSDAEIDGRIGTQDPSDKLVKKLSALITAHAVKTRQPQSVSLGEYREETGGILEAWERDIERIYRLKGTPTIKGSEYRHIDEEKRYPK
jgi:hypothetical protein